MPESILRLVADTRVNAHRTGFNSFLVPYQTQQFEHAVLLVR
jgi:hypothetical protein